MVLCVSNIIWPEVSSAPEGQQRDHQPLVEVTDGWYLLRAQIDLSMTNALKKGKLRVGRKIAVVGSRVDFHLPNRSLFTYLLAYSLKPNARILSSLLKLTSPRN